MSTTQAGNLPLEVFKQKDMFEHITPAMLEERIRNGVTPAEISQIKTALYAYKSVPLGSPLDSTGFLLNNDPWVKWENGNSVYAAQFFA
jgi:NOL1/NOP2/fmu family ribosome biogenesis protein